MKQMHFLLISVGTRGDIEPFMAISDLLTERGHQVTCAFPEQFGHMLADRPAAFRPLTREFIEMVESEDGRAFTGGQGGFFRKVMALGRIYKWGMRINNQLVADQEKIIDEVQPERIIFHGKASLPFLWAIQNPGKATVVCPVPCMIHPVRHMPSLGFGKSRGKLYNLLSYRITNYGLIKSTLDATKHYRKKHHIPGTALKENLLKLKVLYTVSPAFFPEPTYWPDHAKVIGYYQQKTITEYQPDAELQQFLDKHPKILFVTFGSMLNSKPEAVTAMFLEIARSRNIPMIINEGFGGLLKPDNEIPGNVHFVKSIPYSYIFPKMYGVVHHGGSGTTHMTLLNGCVNLIIPHIMDQFMWNRITSGMGLGPKGIPVSGLNPHKLKNLVEDLFRNPAYKTAAEKKSSEMQTCRDINEFYRELKG